MINEICDHCGCEQKDLNEVGIQLFCDDCYKETDEYHEEQKEMNADRLLDDRRDMEMTP